MECSEIKEFLYEFVTKRLDQEKSQRIEEHLKTCKECQEALEKIKKTVSVLDEWKTPELSPGFRESVMKEIEKKPLSKIKMILNKVFKPYHIKLPMEGLALAAILLLTFTIFKTKQPEIKTIPKERGITMVDVKNPIIIETKSVNNSLERLKDFISSHNGKLLQTVPVEKGIRIIFYLNKENEALLFKELNQLGKVRKEKKGYRDNQGHYVIILKKVI